MASHINDVSQRNNSCQNFLSYLNTICRILISCVCQTNSASRAIFCNEMHICFNYFVVINLN
jgi:hypothetical protein